MLLGRKIPVGKGSRKVLVEMVVSLLTEKNAFLHQEKWDSSGTALEKGLQSQKRILGQAPVPCRFTRRLPCPADILPVSLKCKTCRKCSEYKCLLGGGQIRLHPGHRGEQPHARLCWKTPCRRHKNPRHGLLRAWL